MADAHEDRRVRRTRNQLQNALIELLREKPLQGITVRELTERADVNRGTFYAHYKDIYDMVEQMENQLLGEFETLLDNYPPDSLAKDLYPLLSDVFCFVEKNRDLFPTFLGWQTADRFLRRFSRVIYDKCLRDWAGMYPLGDLSEPNYYLEFVVSGAASLVYTWVKRDFRESPEEMARLSGRLILDGFRSLWQEDTP